MLNNNLLALVITFAASVLWLRLNDFAAERGWMSSQLSRKIIHMGTGPIFVLCWLLFNDSQYSRYLAALVPLAITVQFALVGLGVMKDEAAVKAMSRTGDRREILRGPLFYGIVFVVVTVVYWLENPIGVVALMLMCGGDGLADIVGRRWGRNHLPWAPEKSVQGSVGMYVGGWVFAVIVVGILMSANAFTGEYNNYITTISIIAGAGMVVESLPFRDIDNLTVTATAIFIGTLLF